MKSLMLFILLSGLATNQAFAQTPDALVSSYFQGLDNNAAVASGALQKTAVKPKPSRELTPMLMFAKANWDQLTPATQAKVSPFFLRPTDTNATPPISGITLFTQAQETVLNTTHFRFHYVTTGPNAATPTNVGNFALEVEKVWTQEITTMGYLAPPSDGTIGGGVDLYDIYLLDVGSAGIYGYVTGDTQPLTGSPFPNSVHTYMVLDNDFAFSQFRYTDPLVPAKVTLAHEFFHSIQNGYDRAEFPAFLESLSTWMEDKVYNTPTSIQPIKDNLQYIGEPFTDTNGNGQYDPGEPDKNGDGVRPSGSQDYPELHLDSFGLSGNGLEQYGRFMWIRYLSDKFGDALIQTILTNTGNTAGNNTYTAIDSALQAQGSSLAAAFHEFGIWNIDVGKYTNGADYPIAWGDRLFNNGAINFGSDASPSLRCFSQQQKHLSTIYELVNSPNATYTFTTNGTALLSALVQNTAGGAYTSQPIALTGGQATWSAPAGTTKVTFVISNTSATDDAMTWRLTDGISAPAVKTTNTGCPGVATITSRPSRSGCMTSLFSPYLLAWLGLLLLPVWLRKK